MKFSTTMILALLFTVAITSCNSNKTVDIKKREIKIDTTNAVKIRGKWAVPKKDFNFNSLGSSNHDTLSLVTCADFVYSPFGKLKNRAELKSSILKNFKVVSRTENMDNGAFEFLFLNLNANRLILFFDNDPNSATHSYVIKGEIRDSEVNFINGIKIGMTKKDFIKTFFTIFPEELNSTYKYITFISCVEDIEHTYTFEGDKLKSIDFNIVNTTWTVDY